MTGNSCIFLFFKLWNQLVLRYTIFFHLIEPRSWNSPLVYKYNQFGRAKGKSKRLQKHTAEQPISDNHDNYHRQTCKICPSKYIPACWLDEFGFIEKKSSMSSRVAALTMLYRGMAENNCKLECKCANNQQCSIHLKKLKWRLITTYSLSAQHQCCMMINPLCMISLNWNRH